MSTKTTFKRIALVAVAALGFGMLSVAPSSAVLTSFTISKNSASGNVVKLTAGVTAADTPTVTQTAIGGNSATTLEAIIGKGLWIAEDGYLGKVVTAASNFNSVTVDGPVTTITAATATYHGTVATTVVQSGVVADAITGMTVAAGAAGLLNIRGNAVVTTTGGKARFLVNGIQIGASDVQSAATDLGIILPFTAPVTAGTYVGSVQVSDGGTYGADVLTQAFTLTVTANSDNSVALSTAYMGAPLANDQTSTTNAVARSGAKATGTAIATVEVNLFLSTGAVDAQAHTVTASISGAGYVTVSQVNTTPGAVTTRVATNSSADAERYVHIQADGTAGTGIVTVSLTNVNTLVTTVMGTFTVTSYGSATALVVSKASYIIGSAGGNTTGYSGSGARVAESTTPINGASTAAPAFIVKATDSSGALVNLGTVPTIVSSNLTAVAGGTCVLDDGSATYGSGAGVGYYNCSFVSASNSVSGGKSTLTIRTPDPAAPTTFLTTTLDVTLGGSASKGTTTLTLDKTSYSPGEGMTVTVSAKDSAGNPVADGTASPAVSFNKAVGGTAVGTKWFTAGTIKTDDSLGRKTIFAPSVGGEFEASATSAASTALSFAATVAADTTTSDIAQAAADAAAEATDAANAATDAANAAAEAADAATAAAQDAADAVAALSTQVAEQVNELKMQNDALRKQLVAITNLIIKIQKKVKA